MPIGGAWGQCYNKGMSVELNQTFLCPYCGGSNDLLVDISEGTNQEFVVDCEVCCDPVVVRLKLQGELVASLDIERENG